MSEHEAITVAVISLGCPKALVDSETMLAALGRAGCVVGAPTDDADVVLINTCAFIAPARAESMAAIGEAVAHKRAGRVRRVVVAGCLAQRDGPALLDAEPGIDAIVGVFDRDRIVEAVTGGAAGFVAVGPVRDACLPDGPRFRLTGRHTAYLRLSEGCNAGCRYCTIPSIRGPMRSKPASAVLAEAAELVADGAVELNLIAQDTTAYGRDLPGGADLATLLHGLDRVGGLRWIRVMYAHPAGVTDAVIDALAECDRVVKYLDLPLQHVSDEILSAMGRRYGRADVEALLGRLRRRVPGIALRTTFIVGLPGEGRAEFEELLRFVRAETFEAVGVFAYCREAGTPAAALGGQVPEKTKRRRLDRLMRARQAVAFAANAARVGKRVEVLVDGPDAAGRRVGRHAGQAPDVDAVCHLAAPADPGRIVRARVVDWNDYDLIAEAVGD